MRMSLILMLTLWVSCAILCGQSDPDYVPIVGGLEMPRAIVNANDGSNRLFIVEQSGIVKIVTDPVKGTMLNKPFLDIRSKVLSGGEKGLLGMAFHPKYPVAPYVFVSYTATKSGQLYSRVERYTIIGNPNVAIKSSGRTVLEVKQLTPDNNGGDIVFGEDGYLYIAMGDGGGSVKANFNAQDASSLLGGIVRINIDGDDFPYDVLRNYAIPADNPWVDHESYRPELWAMGLRNPQKIFFDPETKEIFVPDVGQDDIEEVNVCPTYKGAGKNFGYKCEETSCEEETLIRPTFAYDHYEGCYIVGGSVYRGKLFPEWHGKYFAADLCSRNLWIVDPINDYTSEKHEMNDFGSLSAIGIAENGEIYVTTSRLESDTLYRLINRAVCPGRLVDEILSKVEGVATDANDLSKSFDNQENSFHGEDSNGSSFIPSDPSGIPIVQMKTDYNHEMLMESCIEQLLTQY